MRHGHSALVFRWLSQSLLFMPYSLLPSEILFVKAMVGYSTALRLLK